jgi:hypothetical protein
MSSFTAALALATCLVGASNALAQPTATAFTYQGELQDNGSPASGLHDVRFRLYDAASAGTQLGSTLCIDNVSLVNGRFLVQLDFGSQFASPGRFLELDVRADTGSACNDSSGFVTLAPRQAITSAPAASFAQTAATASNASFATNSANAQSAVTAGNSLTLNGQPASFYQSASNLTGTLPDPRLSANVPRLNAANTFTSGITAPTFTGALNGNATTATNASNAANLNGQPAAFYLNAGNVNAGTLPIARGGTNATTIGVAGTVAISNGTSLVYSNLGFPGFYFRYNGGGSSSFSAIQATDLPEFAGDVTGFIQSTRVTRLQARPVSSLAPTNGQVLTFTGSSWTPASLATPSVISVSEDVRLIRGSILTSGTISQGSGLTVTRPVTGEYRITFAQPFSQTPTVTATVFDASVPQIATVSSVNTTTVIIKLWSITGVAVNSDFQFIAVGLQ